MVSAQTIRFPSTDACDESLAFLRWRAATNTCEDVLLGEPLVKMESLRSWNIVSAY